MANAPSARVGRARIAGATRPVPAARLCHARRRATMAHLPSRCARRGGPVLYRRRNGRCRVFAGRWMWRPSVIIVTLLFLCTGGAAHPPEAEFADWFRSLKEPGTEATATG